MTPEEMARIHGAAFTDARPWRAKEFADLMATPHVIAATAPNGFAVVRCVAGEAELLTIAVTPALQGRGVGFALMRDWMAQAADSATEAFLEVADDNASARALYEKSGFAVVGRRPAYYPRSGDKRCDALLMRAPLQPVGALSSSNGN